VEDGLIDRVPKIRLPKTHKKMKGRPLTGEELDRCKAAVDKLRPEAEREQWKWILDGLWFSGLRISEAYCVTWNPSNFYIDMSGKHPSYMILGAQKSRQHQRLPVVPDFASMLHAVPRNRRHGKVFRFPGQTKSGELTFNGAKRAIRKIGEKANIRAGEGKTATAHDFRRSFGSRWALKVMPQILQKLMRHAEVTTTMTYYAHLDADVVIESILGDQTGDRNAKIDQSQQERTTNDRRKSLSDREYR
jgi:integrase